MSGHNPRILLLASLLVIFSVAFLASAPPAFSNTSPLNQVQVQNQTAGDYLSVTVWVRLSDKYGLFDTNSRHSVTVFLDARLQGLTFSSQISLSTRISFTGVPPGATYAFWGQPPVSVLNLNIPANSTRFLATLDGFIMGSSVLWKNSAEIPFVSVLSSPVPYMVYLLFVVSPDGSKLSTIYVPNTNVNASLASLAGTSGILVSDMHPNAPVIVLYEPSAWETIAIGTIITSAIVAYIFFYATIFETSRTVLAHGTSRLSRLLHRGVHLDSRKLLSAYLLVAMLMVSLSFSLGPDPRTKVYILAQPDTADQISSFLPQDSLALTVRDEMNELQTLATVGAVPAVVVADFVPPGSEVAELLIFPALASARQIIILQPFAGTFAQEVQDRYASSPKLTVMSNASSLASLRPARTAFFNLGLSFPVWAAGSAFVGLCSFALVFFGLFFLAYKLVEIGKSPGWAGLPEAIAYVIFYFVFTEMIYIVTSVLLAMPVGLHTSTSKVTVVGLMGLGGGSRPRMLAGFLGFLFGSLVALRGGLKLDRLGIIIALATVYFILLDPLTGGRIFYEFVLMFSVGPYLEQGTAAWGTVRNYLEMVVESMGAWVSPTYAPSLGITLFFVGSIPLYFLSRLQKTTGTTMAILLAFPVALGSVRVADLAPWKPMASSIPGIMIGLLVAGGFASLGFIEGFLRRKLAGRI